MDEIKYISVLGVQINVVDSVVIVCGELNMIIILIIFIEVIIQVLVWELEYDKLVLVLGEDVGVNGGVFCVIVGLQQCFGVDCILDILLDEIIIVGLIIGLVVQGMKLVVEVQFDGFMYLMVDYIVCYVVCLCYCICGCFYCLMVLCVLWGGGICVLEYYSEVNEVIFINVLGLCVVLLLLL